LNSSSFISLFASIYVVNLFIANMHLSGGWAQL